jgi:hypothetical protein
MAFDDQLPLNRQAPASTMPVDPASVFAAMQGRGAAPTATPDFSPEEETAKNMAAERGIMTREDLARQVNQGQLASKMKEQEQLEGESPAPPWSPKMTPMTGGGLGGNLLSILHNIGQGMMAVGAATKIGSDIRGMAYQSRDLPYEQKRQALATQIGQLQEQGKTGAEVESASMAAPSRMMSGYGQEQRGAGAVLSGTAAMERASTMAQQVANTRAHELVLESQGWSKLKLDQQKQNFTQWYEKTLTELAQHRIDAGMQENEARVEAQKDLVAAVQQDKYLATSPLKAQFLNWIGAGPEMVGPAGAGTPQVAVPPNPKPAAKTGGAPTGADNEVWIGGKLAGHTVKGKYVPLNAQ